MATLSQSRPCRHRLAGVLPLTAALACAGTPRPPAESPVPPPDPLALLERGGATVSALVVDATTGVTLHARHPDVLVTPASTLKVITVAAALGALGPGHTFHTGVLAAPPDASGTVLGDAWLRGGGDPTFGSARLSHGQPAARTPVPSGVLARWASELRARGVVRITGAVVADGRSLPPPALPAGWAWDDLPYAYSAPPAGLTFLENATQLHLERRGDAVTSSLAPFTSLVDVVASQGDPGRTGVSLFPVLGINRVFASWNGPSGPSADEWISVPSPAAYAAEQLHAALITAGIAVDGGWRVAGSDEPVPALDEAAGEDSAPLHVIAAGTLSESLNLHAEMLALHAGRVLQTAATASVSPPAPETPRTARTPAFPGGVAATAFLVRAGRTAERVRLVDGSGLSRMNLVSARDLVEGLRLALRDDPAFGDLLAVAGRTGTLRERFLGTALEGRLRAKTGSLTGHRNLLGTWRLSSGREVVVAVMVDGTASPRADVDARVDAFLVGLADSLR